MKAIIRNIKVGATAKLNGRADSFIKEMGQHIGKEINVRPHSTCTGWYESDDATIGGISWNWHPNWLMLAPEWIHVKKPFSITMWIRALMFRHNMRKYKKFRKIKMAEVYHVQN